MEDKILDLKEELAEVLYNTPVLFNEERNEYYQIIAGEEGDDYVAIDNKYLPVIDLFI